MLGADSVRPLRGGTLRPDAPHGFVLDTADLPVSRWPHACEAWLRQIGFLSAAEAIRPAA